MLRSWGLKATHISLTPLSIYNEEPSQSTKGVRARAKEPHWVLGLQLRVILTTHHPLVISNNDYILPDICRPEGLDFPLSSYAGSLCDSFLGVQPSSWFSMYQPLWDRNDIRFLISCSQHLTQHLEQRRM